LFEAKALQLPGRNAASAAKLDELQATALHQPVNGGAAQRRDLAKLAYGVAGARQCGSQRATAAALSCAIMFEGQ
jgi:hypothetical protein